MLKVLLNPNFEKNNCTDCVVQTVKKLREFGAAPMLDVGTQKELGTLLGCEYGRFADMVPRCDVLIAIGGDGTILKTVQYGVDSDKPVIGVNAGRIGFLTQIEMHELDQLQLLVEGKYRISKRMLMEVEGRFRGGREIRFALNDVVVTPLICGKIGEISVTQEGREIGIHRSDGLIFSTPTGSTAYSLAAGGSIADPEIDIVLLTAISPYSAFNRSLILPADREYIVREAGTDYPRGLSVAVDGAAVGSIENGDYVTIRRSPVHAQLIDLQLRDFYENLKEKLSLRR